MKIKQFICPSNLCDYVVSGVGFEPTHIEVACLKFGGGSGLGESVGTGIFGGGEQLAYSFSDLGGVNKDSGGIINNYIIQAVDSTGAVAVQARVLSTDSDGFTLRFTQVDTSWTIVCKVLP